MTEKIMELIDKYAEAYKSAKTCGREYISQDDSATMDAFELVCDIFDLYAKENQEEDNERDTF